MKKQLEASTKKMFDEIKQILIEHSLCQRPDIEEDIVVSTDDGVKILLNTIYLGIDNVIFVETFSLFHSDGAELNLLSNLKPAVIEEILTYLKDNEKYIWIPDLEKFEEKALAMYYGTENGPYFNIKEAFGQNALHLSWDDVLNLQCILMDEDEKNHYPEFPNVDLSTSTIKRVTSLWKKYKKENRDDMELRDNAKLQDFLTLDDLNCTLTELSGVAPE